MVESRQIPKGFTYCHTGEGTYHRAYTSPEAQFLLRADETPTSILRDPLHRFQKLKPQREERKRLDHPPQMACLLPVPPRSRIVHRLATNSAS